MRKTSCDGIRAIVSFPNAEADLAGWPSILSAFDDRGIQSCPIRSIPDLSYEAGARGFDMEELRAGGGFAVSQAAQGGEVFVF